MVSLPRSGRRVAGLGVDDDEDPVVAGVDVMGV